MSAARHGAQAIFAISTEVRDCPARLRGRKRKRFNGIGLHVLRVDEEYKKTT
jgi:hypothetical protein